MSRLFSDSALMCMSFLWLEFSQSFQVVAILSTTLAHVVVFGYRFWIGVGLPSGPGFPVVLACQVGVLGCNLLCHLAFLILHFRGRGGCNGMGACLFNSVLNCGLLLLFLNCHLRRAVQRKKDFVVLDEAKKKE